MSMIDLEQEKQSNFVELDLVISNVRAVNNQLSNYKKSITAGDPEVLATFEAQNLGGIKKFRRHGGKGRLRGGVALYTDVNEIKIDRSWWKQLTKRGKGRYVHRRGVRVVRIVYRGIKIALVGTHANPGERGDGKFENIKLIKGIGDIVKRLKSLGYVVLVVADWNRRAKDRGRDTPYSLSKKANLEMCLHKIDGILYSHEVRIVKWEVFKPPGSDHDAIRVKLQIDHSKVRGKK